MDDIRSKILTELLIEVLRLSINIYYELTLNYNAIESISRLKSVSYKYNYSFFK